MTITLDTPIDYPQSKKARIAMLVIDVVNRRAEIHVQLGHLVNNKFQPFNTQPVQFIDDTQSGTTDFTQLVQSVPEFRDLRKALEKYISDRGIFTGPVT